MITALYAGLIALMLVALSLNVIRMRRRDHVSLGDGGNKVLQRRIRAQGNLAEYGPIGLIVLFLLEGGDASDWVVHALGATFVVARAMHAIALSSATPQPLFRTLGMVLTLNVLILGGIGVILVAAGI